MTRTIEHRPLRTRLAPWWGWLLLTLTWLLPSTSGAEGPVTEEVAKALALSKIGDYVKWPAGTFPDARSPVVIGVIGRNDFEEELEQILKNTSENATGRKVIVRQFKDGEPVENCQMLFIAASEKSRMSQILKKLEGTGILTISDLDGFVTRYG
ncbi:MAG: YfiR family protein, partial [Opitutaceae bacterium]|nr:YfiR family protein [Verrucomicrobiales bacterium]